MKKEGRISIGNIVLVLFGLAVVGFCVLAAVRTFRDTVASKKVFEEAVILQDQGKYQEAIDKHLEIPEKYSLSLSEGKYLNELLGKFPKEKIFEVAANLRERYKKDKKRFIIGAAIDLYEYLIETYPEVAVRAEAEKIGAEIEKIGKPIKASVGKKETAKALNGKSEITISHDARDEIEVLFSGASPKRIEIRKGKTGSVLLTPGDYIIGVKDANPSNSVKVLSNSYTAIFKANKSYEHQLRFEATPFGR